MTGTMDGAMRSFVDYFGELGPRWGLDCQACRVHAFLYLTGGTTLAGDIAGPLGLDLSQVREALRYLADWRVAEEDSPGAWRTGSEPWDMLFAGLEERRRREIGPALKTLTQCYGDAREARVDRALLRRIGAVKALVEDLAALDSQVRRFSPRWLRAATALGGSAARLADRVRGLRKTEDP